MAQIIHRIGIAAKIDKVYTLLTTDKGLSAWWTSDTSGAGGVGSLIKFRFNGHGPDFKVIELESNKFVKWQHAGEMPPEWKGTEISFALSHKNNQTYVLFKQTNWQDSSNFMAHCSTKWAVFLLSLKQALETGKGNPFPNDIPIEHDE